MSLGLSALVLLFLGAIGGGPMIFRILRDMGMMRRLPEPPVWLNRVTWLSAVILGALWTIVSMSLFIGSFLQANGFEDLGWAPLTLGNLVVFGILFFAGVKLVREVRRILTGKFDDQPAIETVSEYDRETAAWTGRPAHRKLRDRAAAAASGDTL